MIPDINDNDKNTIIFPGTFDPFTLGHLDILLRSIKSFAPKKVIVAVADDSLLSNKKVLFSAEERLHMLLEIMKEFNLLDQTHAIIFRGMLIDTLKQYNSTCIVRGIRNSVDFFTYEAPMAQLNANLSFCDCETVFLQSTPQLSYISSSMIKEIHSLGGDISRFVPKIVYLTMQNKKKN